MKYSHIVRFSIYYDINLLLSVCDTNIDFLQKSIFVSQTDNKREIERD